jgi:hypothetical protein
MEWRLLYHKNIKNIASDAGGGLEPQRPAPEDLKSSSRSNKLSYEINGLMSISYINVVITY